MTLFIAVTVILATVPFTGCTDRTIEAPPGYRLVWHDEFDRAGLDESRWNAYLGGGGFGNRELQFYRPENVEVRDGNLIITADREFFMSHPFTSGMVTTLGKGSWQYGRFEFRARLPRGQGIWPAIWMLPDDPEIYGTWPASGEIDILELVGHQPDVAHGYLHYGEPHTHTGTSFTLPEGDFSDDYHLFALEWEPEEFRWYIDGELIQTQTEWFSANIRRGEKHPFPAPFDQPFYLRINVAVGGNWPMPPDETTEFPQRLYLDYVRVFQKE
jgi:beta-glucanase (GH16 family)